MPQQKRSRSLWALTLALCSGLSLTLYSFFFKVLNNRVCLGSVLMARGLMEFLFPAIIALIRRSNPCNGGATECHHWIKIVFIAVLGATRLALIFMALWTIPMSSLHAVINCTPIVVILMGAMIGEERITKINAACICLLLAGIGLYFGPDLIRREKIGQMQGLVYGLLALIFTSTVSLLTRKVRKSVSCLWITSFTGLAILTSGVVYCVFWGQKSTVLPSNWQDFSYLLSAAFFGVLQQVTFFAALHLEHASRVTMVRSFQMIATCIIEISQGLVPNAYSASGMVCIFLMIVCNFAEKEISDRRRNKIAHENEMENQIE